MRNVPVSKMYWTAGNIVVALYIVVCVFLLLSVISVSEFHQIQCNYYLVKRKETFQECYTFRWVCIAQFYSFLCSILQTIICHFSLSHCITCPSLIYSFWIPLCYLNFSCISEYDQNFFILMPIQNSIWLPELILQLN